MESQALPPASGGSQPMPEAVRAKMEHALGADFSAAALANHLQARQANSG